MPISQDNFLYLRKLIRERSAILLDDDKCYLADARLARLAGKHSEGDIDLLVSRSRKPGQLELQRELVEAMAINETFFFRDPLLEECLVGMMLPALIKRRQDCKTLKIWCAAASTGQEPYSIAIMMREHFPQLQDWRIEFVASDFSRNALEKARQGIYDMNEVNRGMPTKRLMTWFTQEGLSWQVKRELRSSIDFREINLVGLWPELPKFDIILLRNVMIYFSEDTRRLLLSRLRGQLEHDGYLMLGASETLDKTPDFICADRQKHRPCYQPATIRIS
jgi:chemotaxis protein methyltransferase CheR